MKKHLIYPTGTTGACQYAVRTLQRAGLNMVDHPTPEVTHLLLDVPSFSANGQLRSGGALEKVLETLPEYITIVGGNLDTTVLDGYRKIDLLRDEEYLAKNAWITAECALQVASPLLTTTLQETPTLIIGWGRIGKCLGQLLKAISCNVTVAARKNTDRAMLHALGYKTVAPEQLTDLRSYRLIVNTAPAPVIPEEMLARCSNCVKLDLASQQGLIGKDVVWARGLPGIHAPESSGQLIADTFLRLWKEEM